MKPAILIISFSYLILSLGACKKDKGLNTRIEGSWELRQTSAAMVPGAQPYAPWNGNLLTFMNNQYEKYVNGNLVERGQYRVVKDLTAEENVCLVLPSGLYTNRLIYNDDHSGEKLFFSVSGDKLVFISGCYALDGGHSAEYEKQ